MISKAPHREYRCFPGRRFFVQVKPFSEEGFGRAVKIRQQEYSGNFVKRL